MRIDLLILSILASTALAALVDSARRAAQRPDASASIDAMTPLLRASLEDLERERARMDDHGARLLLALAATAGLAAIVVVLTVTCPELSTVLMAVALGLAAPGLAWRRDIRRQAVELSTLITTLRERVAARDRRASL